MRKETILLLLILLSVMAVILGVSLAIAYGAYWLTLAAGAPKYVAVIVGIGVWIALLVVGSTKNIMYEKDETSDSTFLSKK